MSWSPLTTGMWWTPRSLTIWRTLETGSPWWTVATLVDMILETGSLRFMVVSGSGWLATRGFLSLPDDSAGGGGWLAEDCASVGGDCPGQGDTSMTLAFCARQALYLSSSRSMSLRQKATTVASSR